MSEEEITVTFVRMSFRESSHSLRRQEVDKALKLLRDQLHVHGLTISQSIHGIDLADALPFQTFGDLLHRYPDPRLEIEFFDVSNVMKGVIKELTRTFPDARVLWWEAHCFPAALEARR